ncbi:MAG: DNA-directed RNA polymerase subunit omega, partial [candidate division KSB1 bacterium]|nr:DNA-directed RNA polymerase subunit omega [candidate division KSB1 bacterium]
MASTLSLSELEKYAENIYEAIVVIAKRARQINDEQKRLLGMEVEPEENTTEEYEEEEVNKDAS